MKNLMKTITLFVGLISFAPEVKAPSAEWKAQYTSSLGDAATWNQNTIRDIFHSITDMIGYLEIPDQDIRNATLFRNAFRCNEARFADFGGAETQNLTDAIQFLYGLACNVGTHIGFDVSAYLNNQA